MAFYAEVYGYIARRESDEISHEVIELARKSSLPLFRPSFSVPVPAKVAHYISFACDVKLNQGEDELWLAPFEQVLKRINFLNASVVFVHEEVSHVMMYSYVKDPSVKGGSIQRFDTRLDQHPVRESLIPAEDS